MVKHAHVASGTVLQTVMERQDKTPALLSGLHRMIQGALTGQEILAWLLEPNVCLLNVYSNLGKASCRDSRVPTLLLAGLHRYRRECRWQLLESVSASFARRLFWRHLATPETVQHSTPGCPMTVQNGTVS